MATTILPFVIPKRPPARTRSPGGQATIIIFPGVRYETVGEREDEVSPKGRTGASRSGRKRKAR